MHLKLGPSQTLRTCLPQKLCQGFSFIFSYKQLALILWSKSNIIFNIITLLRKNELKTMRILIFNKRIILYIYEEAMSFHLVNCFQGSRGPKIQENMGFRGAWDPRASRRPFRPLKIVPRFINLVERMCFLSLYLWLSNPYLSYYSTRFTRMNHTRGYAVYFHVLTCYR